MPTGPCGQSRPRPWTDHSKDAYATRSDGGAAFIEDRVRSDRMFLASIARLCRAGESAGSVACIALSEALGVKVNMMHMMDARARRRMDMGLVRDGTGKKSSGGVIVGVE